MQTPADFLRFEKDSLSCPRKVSRGLACLQQCLSPGLWARNGYGGSSVPWGFRVTASVLRSVLSHKQIGKWKLRPQGGVGRGCRVAFCLSHHCIGTLSPVTLCYTQARLTCTFCGCSGCPEGLAVSLRVKTWNGKSLD